MEDHRMGVLDEAPLEGVADHPLVDDRRVVAYSYYDLVWVRALRRNS